MATILNADIGGTNARLQLWEAGEGHATDALRCDQRYPTQTFESAEPLLRRFLADAGLPVPQEADGADHRGPDEANGGASGTNGVSGTQDPTTRKARSGPARTKQTARQSTGSGSTTPHTRRTPSAR